MQDKQIVFARYKENKEKLINKVKYSKVVYCGSNEPTEDDIKIPDVGLEAYAYIYHIVNNYDNLNEYTIFTQADPDPHVESFELAIDSTFTGGFGSFCYARSLMTQYGQGWVRSLPLKQVMNELGIYFDNDNNCSKNMYCVLPGTAFYVSRDRIRQRPKSFYQKMLEICNDKKMIELLLNYEYPHWYYNDISIFYPKLRGLSRKSKLEKLAEEDTGRNGNIAGCTFEALWYTIFLSLEQLDILNKKQMSIGNSFGTYSNNGIDKMFFKLMENDAFDYDCPNYLKWREKLIEKTMGEGIKFNFNPNELLEYYKSVGYKHITL